MADKDNHSELRLDPVSREWVIIAPQRSIRPRDMSAGTPSVSREDTETCPFCPGNEAMTPPAVLHIPDSGDTRDWKVRVVPNKFPALRPEEPPARAQLGLFQRAAGRGRHEVIIDTPVHGRMAADFSEDEMALVVNAYQRRFEAIMAEEQISYVLIFKNHGERAGASLTHSHTQVLGSSVVPEAERRREVIAAAHLEKTRRCLYCDVIGAEEESGSRMVQSGESFTVFEPYAAARPGETWIMPVRHASSFGQIEPDEVREFAATLCQTLRRLRLALDDPDFIYAIHSASALVKSSRSYHWRLQLIPQITTVAGFEFASGMYVNTITPEDAASAMRASRPASQ